jgi:subtilisin family serine protease
MARLFRPVIAPLAATALLIGCATAPSPGGQNDGPLQSPETTVQLSTGNASATFEMENTSAQALDWRIEVEDDRANPQEGSWFTTRPSEGSLEPYGRRLVTLTQRSGIAPGNYRSKLEVLYPGGPTVFSVTGEVIGNGSNDGGGASIRGTLRTDNALIPIRAPRSFATSSATAPRGQEGGEGRPAFVPGQLIVALEPATEPLSARSDGVNGREPSLEAEALAERHGFSLLSDTPERVALVSVPVGSELGAAERLERDEAVAYAEPNYLFYPHGIPNDPYLSAAWHMPVVGAPVAWAALGGLGTGPVTAVIDSGIDLDHEDLAGIFVSSGRDFCGSPGCLDSDGDVRPDFTYDTHGTHVTGLLAATAANGRGLAGVVAQGARILPVKVFHEGSTTAEALAKAIRWAAGESVAGTRNPQPANIITLSLGAAQDSSTVRLAVEAAQARGVLIVASTGNQGERSVDFPARYPDVIGVGSVNTRLERSCFSDYGPGLDLMAPGGDGYLCGAENDEALLSTFPGDAYGIDAGTSMAAPLVAGAAALVWADMRHPSAELVTQRLLDTAYFESGQMSEERYGAGIVRVDAALGFPGPGDIATVEAAGPSTALDTVTLDPTGGSSAFSLEDLSGGSYTVRADAAGRSRALNGANSTQLSDDQDLDGLTVTLAP